MIGSDELRKQFFDDYIKSISEACGHHHSSRSSDKKKKSKKEKKKKHKRDRVGVFLKYASSLRELT